MTEDVIESPCISVCAMSDDADFCIGCYRTLEEIQGWWDLDNTEKKKIVDTALARQQSVFD